MPQGPTESNMVPQPQPQSMQRTESAGAAAPSNLPPLTNPASMPQLNQPNHQMPEQNQEENKEKPSQST